MNRWRVLLCGSNYGRQYAHSIGPDDDLFELAGLLARGSDRSRRLAERLKVPLYLGAAEVPDDIDMACAALGSGGDDVVLALLQQGVHVLCEHPQPEGFVTMARATAEKAGVRFHVNSHFPDLPASRAFIEHSGQIRQSAAPVFVHVTVADRFLHAALDILRRALGSLEPVALQPLARGLPFTVAHGNVAGIPATFHLQSSRRPDGTLMEEASAEYVVCYRMEVGFPAGILSLLSVDGPVLWHVNENVVMAPDLPLVAAPHLTPGSTNRTVGRHRIEANRRAMQTLMAAAAGQRTPSEQEAGPLLEVSRAWETLGRLLRA